MEITRECADRKALLDVLLEESAPLGSALEVALCSRTKLLAGFSLVTQVKMSLQRLPEFLS